eukprot:SAG22_NODE_623_length_8459_cov_39.989474_5_plen_51_part_00
MQTGSVKIILETPMGLLEITFKPLVESCTLSTYKSVTTLESLCDDVSSSR